MRLDSYADELIRNALWLRMYGDIDHMPMSQREWDIAAEQYLRRFDGKLEPHVPYLDAD